MSRRTGIDKFISPSVISGYIAEVPEDGIVFRALAGIEGELISGCIETEELPKDTQGVAVFVAVENRDGSGKSERFATSKGRGEVEATVPVGPRSKITISTDCVGAKGVWVAVSIRPNATSKFMQRIESNESGIPLQPRSKVVTRRT